MKIKDDMHPLARKSFSSIGDWRTWRYYWDMTETTEGLIGLLHEVLKPQQVMVANEREWVERICFLLQLADGHDCFESEWDRAAVRPDFYDERSWAAHIKAGVLVAKKAFAVLCDWYFKQRCGGEGRDQVELQDDLTPELLETLLWFFCDDDRRQYSQNMVDSRFTKPPHLAETARAYAFELVKQVWHVDRWCDSLRGDDIEAMRTACVAARPRLVALLGRLGKLFFLTELELDHKPQDEATVAAFLAIAEAEGRLRGRDVDPFQMVETPAGRSFILFQEARTRMARTRELAEAKRAQRAAEARVRELTP